MSYFLYFGASKLCLVIRPIVVSEGQCLSLSMSFGIYSLYVDINNTLLKSAVVGVHFVAPYVGGITRRPNSTHRKVRYSVKLLCRWVYWESFY